MLAIALGLMLTVVVALGIMLVVAVPSMREGSRILTPEGEAAVRRAKRQAKAKPRAAAGTTWQGLIGLRRLIARGWAPVSAALHSGFDRLESRDAEPAMPIRHAAHPGEVRAEEPSEPVGHLEPAAPSQPVTSATVGRPRAVPPISGPIPTIERVIDLRDDTPQEADQTAGSARHAR